MYHSGRGSVCKFHRWALLTVKPYFPSKIYLVVYLVASFINRDESFILVGFNSSVDVDEGEEGRSFFLSACDWKP